MVCTAFTATAGLFIDVTSGWSVAPSQTAGGRGVTRSAAGLTITSPSGSLFVAQLGGYVARYMFFGSENHLLVLQSSTGAGPVTHQVSLIDFRSGPPVERALFTGTASSAAVPLPNVQWSQGSGSAVLVFSSNGTDIHNLAIYRSKSADLLCSGPPPFVPSGETQGIATATEVQISYQQSGLSRQVIGCPWPAGRLAVVPQQQTFPQAVVGGPAALASTTAVFTLRNTGDDCLTVQAIGNSGPFVVSATSRPLPADLEPTATMTVTVRFTPSSTTPTGLVQLPVTRTGTGDATLGCRGTARLPRREVRVSPSSLAFGSVPVGGDRAMSVTVTNAGEQTEDISWPGSATAPFTWDSWSSPLAFGSSRTLTIRFAPGSEGPAPPASVVLTHTAPGSPHTVTFSGSGCIPNAVIAVPPLPFPAFGQIERGFRTVRFIRVRNTGDAPLSFRARIAGTDAAFFGLQSDTGSVTQLEADRTYSGVLPVVACGPGATGTGEVIVAVGFFANDAPSVKTAELVIEDAAGMTGVVQTFPLRAEIIALTAVDACVVLDRSGSMADTLGTRTKSDAAISAGRLFVELARPDVDDRLAVIRFSTVPDIVAAITAVTAASQPGLVSAINPSTLAPNGWTAVAGGMAVGYAELTTPRPMPPPTLRKALVVMTDGIDNRAYQDPVTGQWLSLLGGDRLDPGGTRVATQPIPTPADVAVYAVGLGNSQDVDIGSLSAIASTTSGALRVTGDLAGAEYFTLEKIFTEIYMNTVGLASVSDPMFTIDAGDEHRFEFDVLRGDTAVLVVLFDVDGGRLPFQLMTPLGELIDGTKLPPDFQLRTGITPTARFVELGLPVSHAKRYAGRWTAVITHRGELCFDGGVRDEEYRDCDGHKSDDEWGFVRREECADWADAVPYGIAVGVGSNLRMQPYVTPRVVHVGEPIELTAFVAEAGLPVIGCVVEVSARSPSGVESTLSLADDGLSGDGTADDGVYARTFPWTYEAGSYMFTFRATGMSRDGEPMVRESVLGKYVEGHLPIRPPDGGGNDSQCCERLVELLSRRSNIDLEMAD